MSKYKVGDKVVMEITDKISVMGEPNYILSDAAVVNQGYIDKAAEQLSKCTEPLEKAIKNLNIDNIKISEKNKNKTAEITRLLAENKRLKAENGNSLWNIEQAKAEGQNEAWELARKILNCDTCNGISVEKRQEIFDTVSFRDILNKNTYPEAAAKVEAWEKAKEEIKVGDEVENNVLRDERFIVTFTNGKSMSGVTQSGPVVINEKPKE